MCRISAKTLSLGLFFLAFAAQCARGEPVSVVQPTYSSILIQADLNETIYDLKQQVRDRIGVVPDSQLLYFGGSLLEDGNTLSGHGVTVSSTISLVATAAFISTPLPNTAWSFGVRDVSAGPGSDG